MTFFILFIYTYYIGYTQLVFYFTINKNIYAVTEKKILEINKKNKSQNFLKMDIFKMSKNENLR
jgi:hypothetical protein